MKIAPATPAQLDTLIAIYSACKRQLWNGPLFRYYEKMGYRRRHGEARFPGRRYPFLPYEKIL